MLTDRRERRGDLLRLACAQLGLTERVTVVTADVVSLADRTEYRAAFDAATVRGIRRSDVDAGVRGTVAAIWRRCGRVRTAAGHTAGACSRWIAGLWTRFSCAVSVAVVRRRRRLRCSSAADVPRETRSPRGEWQLGCPISTDCAAAFGHRSDARDDPCGPRPRPLVLRETSGLRHHRSGPRHSNAGIPGSEPQTRVACPYATYDAGSSARRGEPLARAISFCREAPTVLATNDGSPESRPGRTDRRKRHIDDLRDRSRRSPRRPRRHRDRRRSIWRRRPIGLTSRARTNARRGGPVRSMDKGIDLPKFTSRRTKEYEHEVSKPNEKLLVFRFRLFPIPDQLFTLCSLFSVLCFPFPVFQTLYSRIPTPFLALSACSMYTHNQIIQEDDLWKRNPKEPAPSLEPL